VISEKNDWSRYKIIVLPDNVLMTDLIQKKVKAHLAAGKKIIASHKSGFEPGLKGFMFEKEWGARFIKDNDFAPAFFTIAPPYGRDLPDMPLSLYSMGIEMAPIRGTGAFGKMIKSFCNFGWDGEHINFYAPPYEATDLPILVAGKQVAHFSHPIFDAYYKMAPVPLRQLFANVLDEFLSNPVLKTQNLPSFARAMVTEKASRKMAHLFAYVPEKRGASKLPAWFPLTEALASYAPAEKGGSATEMIEEPITVCDAVVRLRLDGKIPGKVYMAPDRKRMEFKIRDGYLEIPVPMFKGYALLVAEE
jgi:hypothetical protein